MRSPDTAVALRAPIQQLLAKELREIASGRALWIMLLIFCPLVGYSFFQAVSLYGEASAAAVDSPVLGSGLSPLDGVLVPTFGGLYLAATLLFPFVAIRTLGRAWCRVLWRCWQDNAAYDPARHRGLQHHIAVTIPDPSRPRLDLTATQRMAGAAVTRRAARSAEREALDSKPTTATSTKG